jgi:hypothetical protein
LSFILGYVALVVGGYPHKEAELYSPDGNCQHNLAPVPISSDGFYMPVLAFIDHKILACGGYNNKNCFQYHPNNDTWSIFSISKSIHSDFPGEIFNEKLFLADCCWPDPEVLDPVSNTWSSWPSFVPHGSGTGVGSCLVAWQDTFILLRGKVSVSSMQSFNHSTNTWEVVDLRPVPMGICDSSCVLLPSDEILVVGSAGTPDQSSAALYNMKANSWKELPKTTYCRDGASLVILGSRIFAMDGRYNNTVEEFDYNSSSWSLVAAKLITHRGGYQDVIALPAEMFQHLPGGCVGVQ